MTGFVALAATVATGFASAEISGANAQPGVEQEITAEPLTEEVVPEFEAGEIVQPIPTETEAPAVEAVPSAGSLRELVSSVNTPDTLSREMECLAGTVYFEPRGEPLNGQLAVGQIVINRAESDLFPSSYCGVVYQPKQFSFVRGGSMPRIRRGSQAWTQAKAIARIAHEGLWESEARDSLYFHARYVSPKWSRTKQARATISTHVFYR